MKVNLDINQRNAVYIKEKNVLVVASPGSGKTTVIINRVNHLIEDLKINEGNIIVITFTRAAADNMRNRYKNIFKKEKGCSLSKYLTQTRLEQAKKYLTEYPDKTLIEIAESIGYSDVYYFSKNFKKYYGISPSKYQEERKM